MVQFTRVVAAELGEHGVLVNSISPGGIMTGIFGKAAKIDLVVADQQAGVLPDHLSTLQPTRELGGLTISREGALIDGGLLSGNRFLAGAAARRDIYNILTRDAGTRG